MAVSQVTTEQKYITKVGGDSDDNVLSDSSSVCSPVNVLRNEEIKEAEVAAIYEMMAKTAQRTPRKFFTCA